MVAASELLQIDSQTQLRGDLCVPPCADAVVLFAHAAASNRRSSWNRKVAAILNQSNIGTLLIDLLTEQEELEEKGNELARYNVSLQSERLSCAIAWLRHNRATADLPICLFGINSGAAAAIDCAADNQSDILAVVSFGGQTDLAGNGLMRIITPTLFIAGELDRRVIRLNFEAQAQMKCRTALKILPGASDLFEESDTIVSVAELALGWLRMLMPQEQLNAFQLLDGHRSWFGRQFPKAS